MRLLFCALLLCAVVGCRKKSESTASPTSSQDALIFNPPLTTPAPISGPVTPALVGEESNSISRYLHYPKDPAAAKLEEAVQFYSDVAADGAVEYTYALVGRDAAFKKAVQSALDWGRFTPARVDEKAIPVYLAGTVLFFHEEGKPVIVISLATQDRERVGKLANYIQPQLIGGLRQTVERTIRNLARGILVNGRAETVVNVDAQGTITGTSAVSETPRGSGLGDLLNSALKHAQFTPAYENGKPSAGAINVVADFSQL